MKPIRKNYYDDGREPETTYDDAPRTVSRAEQERLGMVKRSNFTAPLQGEVLPPAVRTVQQVPTVVDPYAANLPQTVQQVVRYDVTPESRARSMVMKVNTVTIALSVLTGAAMLMLSEWSFLAWLALASGEWVAVFIFLAILDYRETPQSLARHTATKYIGLMEKEQAARLRAMYGDKHDSRKDVR